MSGTSLRPIDEIPATADVIVKRNQAITWLVDSATGVEYLPPTWLVKLVTLAEDAGYCLAQAVMREALGIDDPAEAPPGAAPPAVAELPSGMLADVDSESTEADQQPNPATRRAEPGGKGTP